MSRVLVIGAGGVGSVAVHKMAMNKDIFSDIHLASRTKSKCDAIAESVKQRTGVAIATYAIDADDVAATTAHVHELEKAAHEAVKYQRPVRCTCRNIIFDCDGDRGAVVFSDGTEVNRNALIALMAAIVKEGHPGSTVVTDSVTSDELTEFLEGELGLVHLRYKRGYKNVIDKGIELNKDGTDCELAIETSGHGALKENYFSDDGAYMCVKIICKMAKMKQEGRKIEDLISSLKMPAESKEVRYRISGEDFKEYAAGVLKDFENFASHDERFHVVEPNFEGVRVSFDDDEVKGWLLLRMSLHDPVMPMNAEAEKEGGVGIILGRIQPFISRYEKLS